MVRPIRSWLEKKRWPRQLTAQAAGIGMSRYLSVAREGLFATPLRLCLTRTNPLLSILKTRLLLIPNLNSQHFLFIFLWDHPFREWYQTMTQAWHLRLSSSPITSVRPIQAA